MDAAESSDHLLSRADLVRRGMTPAAIADERRSGGLVRIARGAYVRGESWGGLHAGDRHLLRVAAVAARATGPAVASHLSAAVVHGLPLYGREPQRVQMTGPGNDGRVTTGDVEVARHRVAGLPASQTDEVGGIRVTSLPRTVADVLRTAGRAAALAVADAALRTRAWDAVDRRYDDAAASAFREEVARLLRPGARGVRQARALLEEADGRAESVGESVSRLHLLDLGFARPRLQVAVPAPSGRAYFVDLGLDDVGVWGEFDGEQKYRDPAFRNGRTLEEVLRAEKARHDWIVGTTGRRIVRWGWGDIGSAASLRVVLARFHVRAGRPDPRRFHPLHPESMG